MDRQREFVVRAALGCGRGRLIRQAGPKGRCYRWAEPAAACSGVVCGSHPGVEQHRSTSRGSYGFLEHAGAHFRGADRRCGGCGFRARAGIVRGENGYPFLVEQRRPWIDGTRASVVPSTSDDRGADRGVFRGIGRRRVSSAQCVARGDGPLGFRTENILGTHLDVGIRDADRRIAFHQALLDKLQALPGVTTAAIASFLPPSLDAGDSRLEIRGRPPKEAYDVASCAASPGTFSLTATPLLHGRLFDARDQRGGKTVAVVSESLVKEYFSGLDPLGQEIRVLSFSDTSPWMTIVGVVGDWKHLEWQAQWIESPLVFRPLTQDPSAGYAVAVGTQRKLSGMTRAMSEAILALAPAISIDAFETIDSRLASMRAYPRFRAFLVSFFAWAALVITSVGLHGTLTQIVARRTPELGLRRAVGAQTWDLLWLVGRQGGVPLVAGLAAGVVAVPVVARILGRFFVGVRLVNFGALSLAAVLLVVVAGVAVAMPARRASRVDPMVALREE